MPLPPKVQEERESLSKQVVKDILSGKPFFWDSGHYGRPHRNLIADLEGKDTKYHGINNMMLTIAANYFDFKDTRWATFNQVKSLQKEGLPHEEQPHIKKGSKGIPIEYWQYTKKVMEKDPATGELVPKMQRDPESGEMKPVIKKLNPPLVRRYIVFNGDQIANIPPAQHEITIDEKDRDEAMEAMIANSEAEIVFDQKNRNYYQLSTDCVHVMPREDFKTLGNFYATVAHEIAHSTGAEHRMNRDGIVRSDGFGGEIYAKEELRAEMASMFLAQEYGVAPGKEHYENHVAYLQNWAEVIEKDPDELFRAAAEAQKITDYIKEHMIEKKLQIEKVSEKIQSKEEIKEAIRSKADDFLEKLSAKLTFVEKGIGTDEEIVIGGGKLSFSDYTIADAISREMTPGEEIEKLGGRLYQCEKEYRGSELNELMNDLIKDDATASLGNGGYVKTYVTITHPDVPVKLSDRWDIGDGNTFNLSNAKNGYMALVNYLKETATPFRDVIEAADGLEQKTADWEKPSFKKNTELYKNMLTNLTVGDNISVNPQHSHEYFRDKIKQAEQNQYGEIIKDLQIMPIHEELKFYEDLRFRPSYSDIKTVAHLKALESLGHPYTDDQTKKIEKAWNTFKKWPSEKLAVRKFEVTQKNLSEIIQNTSGNTIKKTKEKDFQPIKRSITIPDKKPQKKKKVTVRRNAPSKDSQMER